jgi:hypothetical protein
MKFAIRQQAKELLLLIGNDHNLINQKLDFYHFPPANHSAKIMSALSICK